MNESELKTSNVQVLQQLEAWIERAKGRHLTCPQIHNYPHFGYVCDYDERCEGCMIVAAVLELKRPAPETGECSACRVLDDLIVELCDLIGAEHIPDRIYKRVESRHRLQQETRVCDCPEGDDGDPSKHEGYCDTQKAGTSQAYCEHGYRPTFCPKCPQNDTNAMNEINT